MYYARQMPGADTGPFLKEEDRLIHTVADRLSHFVQHQELRRSLEEFHQGEQRQEGERKDEWRGAVHLLRATDLDLYLRIARRMVNYLRWNGGEEVQAALWRARLDQDGEARPPDAANYPGRRRDLDNRFYLSDEPFEMTAAMLGDDRILGLLQQWMLDDKAGFLVRVLAKPESSLGDVANALRRFQRLVPREEDLPRSTASGLKVSLIRRFLTDQLEFISVAKENVEIADFQDVVDRLVLPARSHGKLGGKSAGLFLARQVLSRGLPEFPGGLPLAFPKSWYVVSDGLSDFVEFNGLQEWVIEQKYKDGASLRQEYPHLVHLFKNSSFSPDVVKGLSMALDDFGTSPLVARSSSLAEDRLGTAFSGKYKSLFLANQGTKQQRLGALLDAIAEIYASTFGPDAIEYRRERGLLDFDEDMGILLQEVVGVRSGRYYFPSFAGVALSTNEFRWSPRIAREDGLLRIVPGLGTRAVDRLTDDYPVLIAPGRPGLRANATVEEVVHYAPRRIDVIDLETNAFESRGLYNLVREVGAAYPGFTDVFSVLKDGQLRRPSSLLFEPGRDEVVATFEGLMAGTRFVEQMRAVLAVLEQRLGVPVELEFACDGTRLFMLQCRSQSYSEDAVPVAIPRDPLPEDVLFRGTRHVSNGLVPDITHVVYVDPAAYDRLDSLAQLQAVGRAIGSINRALPRRRFILMGPGRWGSRGDIRLGVNVSYADINNTAVLVEIARPKGELPPGVVLRHALLPGPGGVVHPLRAPLPGRPQHRVPTSSLARRAEPSRVPGAGARGSLGGDPRGGPARRHRGQGAEGVPERRGRRGSGHARLAFLTGRRLSLQRSSGLKTARWRAASCCPGGLSRFRWSPSWARTTSPEPRAPAVDRATRWPPGCPRRGGILPGGRCG